MTPTPEQRALLDELKECQEQINDAEYTEEQRAALREMAKRNWVSLRWCLTPGGDRARTLGS